jgi:Na+/H+ antiporter NhaC
MIIYWLLIKYIFTGINLPSVTADTNFGDMISAALYYNIVTLIVSLISYFPIVYGIKKIKLRKEYELILTGIILTLTTPILYLFLKDWKHNDYYELKPEIIAWSLCFIISIGFYYLANNRSEKKTKSIINSG